MDQRSCLVCGGRLAGARISALLECGSCGFLTAEGSLGAEELATLYGESYFSGAEYRDYVAERAIIEENFRRRLGTLLRYVPEPNTKRLFEIGCAYGFFLSLARERFRDVEGIDISPHTIRYATEELGLRATAADFLSHRPKEKYDVFCLWDPIEHVARPDQYLEKISECLNPGGVVAITTGDVGSFVARWRQARWRQIHPPTHLHYFSRRTLLALLKRYGLSACYCGCDGMYRSVDTMAHGVLVVKHGWRTLYERIRRLRLAKWDVYVDLRDIMFVIAAKPQDCGQPTAGTEQRANPGVEG